MIGEHFCLCVKRCIRSPNSKTIFSRCPLILLTSTINYYPEVRLDSIYNETRNRHFIPYPHYNFAPYNLLDSVNCLYPIYKIKNLTIVLDYGFYPQINRMFPLYSFLQILPPLKPKAPLLHYRFSR